MKKSVGITAALLAMGGVLAAYFWLQLRDERQRGSELMARVEALEAVAPAAPSAGVAPAGATSPQAATPPVVQAQGGGADSDKSPMAAILATMQTPQGREATRMMMRGMMTQLYPDVEQELGITAEEKEKLFDLLIRQQDDMTAESLALVTGGGDPAAARDLQRRLMEKEAEHQRELTALLGGKYPQWEEYQGTAVARQQLGQLRLALAASGHPLSGAQETALVKAFAGEVTRSQKEEREWMLTAADSPDVMQESMRRALKVQQNLLALSKPHLTDAQLAQFRRQIEQQEKMLESMMGMLGGQGKRP
jgi:hypothetical protein